MGGVAAVSEEKASGMGTLSTHHDPPLMPMKDRMLLG